MTDSTVTESTTCSHQQLLDTVDADGKLVWVLLRPGEGHVRLWLILHDDGLPRRLIRHAALANNPDRLVNPRSG